MRTHRRTIIAHHLILTLYGHWLANDLRGSGSAGFHDDKFAPLGPIHHGRKPAAQQPTRGELRAFYREADPLLNFPRFWLNDAKRQAVAEAFGEVVERERYTVWACAILSNHAHLVVRRHRDDASIMLTKLADESARRLRRFADIGATHPVWAARPYKVFIDEAAGVRSRIRYVEDNPEKEGLTPQHWPFVQPYDNWPHAGQ